MKKLLLIALTAGLLSGCQSKREICADVVGGNISCIQGMKKLGMKDKGSKYCSRVGRYCEFYKN